MAKMITPLKLAIVASGRSQREVAKAVGISEQQLSLIVNGLHADERTQKALARELRQTRADLFPTVTGEAA